MKENIMLFAQLVSEIDISKYEQKEYVEIVNAIYFEIFGEKKSAPNSKESYNLPLRYSDISLRGVKR